MKKKLLLAGTSEIENTVSGHCHYCKIALYLCFSVRGGARLPHSVIHTSIGVVLYDPLMPHTTDRQGDKRQTNRQTDIQTYCNTR